MVVEPAGAAGVAAMIDEPTAYPGPIGVVLSGGNIDPLLLGRVIRHGLAAAGRYVSLRVTISDAAGSLAALLAEIGRTGANVLEVVHARTSPALAIDMVHVHLQLETRSEAHAAEVVSRLRERGYLAVTSV
jgi:threonine dehydratase